MQIENLENRNLMSATTSIAADAIPQQPKAALTVAARNASQSVVSYGMTAGEKRVSEQLTSIFENWTTELQYEYIQALPDGRGFTAGRAGFCSGTGDMLMVVERYSQLRPGNALEQYLPRLREVNAAFEATWSEWHLEQSGFGSYEEAAAEAASVYGFGNLAADWAAAAANDATFRAAQDAIVDELYYQPAMERAQQVGLTTALAKAALHDAIIQHGNGEDPDGLQSLIQRATNRTGGTPAQGKSETTWLKNFLAERKATLEWAHNADTRDVWQDSVERVQPYVTLLNQGNMGLTGTLYVSVFEGNFTIQGASSGTPAPTPTPVPPPPPPAPVPAPSATGSISGTVFYDGNEDGSRGEWDDAAAGQVVFIDADGDMYLDAGEVSATTDANGRFKFEGLAAGDYKVCLQSVEWAYCTTPITHDVDVNGGQNSGNVNFGLWGEGW